MKGRKTVVAVVLVISIRLPGCSPERDMLDGEGSLYGQKE
jgi:hypothetical protein